MGQLKFAEVLGIQHAVHYGSETKIVAKTRTYLKTHPWLRFKVNLERASPRLWMNLGEVRSKCEHIAGVPLRPTVAERLHQIYLAKGVLGTTAIEGNTLSVEEVIQHLEGKLDLPPSKEYLKQEVDNILRATRQIASDLSAGGSLNLSTDRLKQFNAIVLQGLNVGEGVVPGEVRTHSVGVLGYRGAPAEDCEYLLEQLCEWLNGPDFHPPSEADAVVYAVIKAILAHLYLAWIHPFGDGNGRTARLAEFQILLAAGIPMPAAHLLSNHYNQTRQEYYRQLDQASKSGGDILPFLDYAIEGLVDGLRAQLVLVKEQLLDVVWISYVHRKFHGKDKAPDLRQRDLALDLGKAGEIVPLSKITDLSPRLARAYARLDIKTLRRDVDELVKLGLVDVSKEGVKANREAILAFLPLRAQPKVR